MLNLFSPGGNVDEALVIGQSVRKNRIITNAPFGSSDFKLCETETEIMIDRDAGLARYPDAEVNSDCICASACSLIWFGGIVRLGTVGVHRSYLPDVSDISFEEYETNVAGSHAAIAEYLKEMRVPTFVFEKLRTTSSQTLTEFSGADIGGDVLLFDSVFAEYLSARCPGQLTNDETTTLAWLSVMQANGEDLSRDEISLLKELEERNSESSKCTGNETFNVQKQSQLDF